MKTINYIFLSLWMGVMLLSACSNEIDNGYSQHNNYLNISTEIENTRSVRTGNTFSKGDSISLKVLLRKYGLYTDSSSNIRADYDGSSWTLSRAVALNDNGAYVCAFYPYDKNATYFYDYAIDVTPNPSSGQTDFLYGKSSNYANAANPTAKILFNHVLSRITLQITKASTDNGDGKLTSVVLRNSSGSNVISQLAKLSYDTGILTPTKDINAKITIPTSVTLSNSPTSVDILVIPTRINNNAEIELTVDGSVYNTKISADTLMAGHQYIYPISINRTSGSGGGTVPAGGTVGNMVDLGLSVKWADHNVGATNPENYGGYFAWGETATKSDYSESTSKWYNVSYASLQSQGVIDSNGNLSTTYDAATVNWGKSWRMPTKSELDELKTKCTWTWTTTSNGIHGYKVVGTNGNSIFLPAAGGRGYSVLDAGSGGYCWSSTASAYDYRAYSLIFYSGLYGWYYRNRCYGYSVRPVTE